MRNLKLKIEGNGVVCDVLYGRAAIVIWKCFEFPDIYKEGTEIYLKDCSDSDVNIFYRPASKRRVDEIRRRKYAKRLKDQDEGKVRVCCAKA